MAQRLSEKGDHRIIVSSYYSFGYLRSYEDRGEQFKQTVKVCKQVINI
jgi:UDP-N-acetylmuramoylalanine-D-glutamate ligase